MRNIGILLLSLCIPLSLNAQGWLGRMANKVRRTSAPKVRTVSPVVPVVPATASAPSAALRATELRQHTQAIQQFARMEQVLHAPTIATATSRQTWLQDRISVVTDQDHYSQVMQDFETLKQEASPFLYYQAKPSESRTFHPAEIRQWLERVSEMRRELNSLRKTGVTSDPALENAYAYLEYIQETLAPGSIPMKAPAQSYKISNRELKENEFFLQDPFPATNCWDRMLAYLGRQCGVSIPSLPENLTVVVFYDNSIALEKLKTAQDAGRFFPKSTHMFFLDDISQVRQHIILNRNYPDLLITDLTTSNGLEGALLIQDLRANGYAGTAIALTGYSQEQVNAPALLHAGLDGMFSLWDHTDSGPQSIAHAVQNYFYYRDLHDWTRP